jgi:hypothetical protein
MAGSLYGYCWNVKEVTRHFCSWQYRYVVRRGCRWVTGTDYVSSGFLDVKTKGNWIIFLPVQLLMGLRDQWEWNPQRNDTTRMASVGYTGCEPSTDLGEPKSGNFSRSRVSQRVSARVTFGTLTSNSRRCKYLFAYRITVKSAFQQFISHVCLYNNKHIKHHTICLLLHTLLIQTI